MVGGGVVGGRDAHKEWLGLGPDGAHGGDNLEEEPDAILERPAIEIVALFDDVDPSGVGTHCGRGEGRNDAPDVIDGEGMRLCVAGVGQIRGAPDIVRPATFDGGSHGEGHPGRANGGLTAGVGELDAEDAALRVNEVGDATDGVDLRVFPKARILRGDTALGFDSGGLHTDKTSTLEGEGAKVGKVEVVEVAVVRAVHAHGGDADAVTEGEPTDGERLEELCGVPCGFEGACWGNFLRICVFCHGGE
ncbi:hypothetical protein BC936DRAFT_145402 [Jimgerdemannia flammicorona]|uniref:Uncharacterized protein n=1 Tax=Jimgerdemannia flammicorona TaxID=994334 RepID=A0A433DA54_9FUNG|nr:hypothetical protein BC936DRAFT_145402 [Jimgerdemannia flammicorona]